MEKPKTLKNPLNNKIRPFPPHRRRHLKSETFYTLIKFLSISPQQGGVNNELGKKTDLRVNGNEITGSQNFEASCANVVNVVESVSDDRMETNEVDLGNTINKELALEKGRDSNALEQATLGCGDAYGTANFESEILSTNGACSKVMSVVESVHEDRMEIDEFNSVKRISNEFSQETGFEIPNSLQETNPESCVVSCSLTTIDEWQNGLVESLLKDSELTRNADVKGLHQVVSLDMGETAKCPILDGNEEVKSSIIESSESHQVDLENSLSKYGLADSLLCVAVDEETEEGEISGDLVMDDELIDFLNEEEQTSGPTVNTERITNQNQKGTSEVGSKCDKVFGVIDEIHKGVESNLRESNVLDIKMESGRAVSEGVKAKLAHGYEMVREIVSYKTLIDSATTRQGGLSTGKDAGVERKRKKGPITQEKRAKKKKKERLKRAEENRKLGVKRLKIQPVLKPKTIQYCRHYLNGRCQEGDKCKYSHDTTPLTKSMPCCYFAKGLCQKDDCQYDHQLSKYPCNNIVSYGVCNRGTKCKFSHEVRASEGTPSGVNFSNSEVKLSSLCRVTNTEKNLSLHKFSNQKVDSKIGSSGVSSPSAEIRRRAAAPAPKRISKLLIGKSPLGNESKLVQAGTTSKADGNVKVNLPVVNNTYNMVSILNRTPKGLSFMSFGKDSTHDILMDKDKQATSPSKPAENLKSANHTGENSKGLVPNLTETPKKTPSMPPRGINFLSFGKSVANNSSNMLSVTPSGADTGASSSAREGELGPKLLVQLGKGPPSSALKALLSNGTRSAQKALQSTLAFATKCESSIKTDHPVCH